MTIHDAYARRTPYELALPSREFGDERFPLVAEDAEAQGFPGYLTDIEAFPLLGEVGAILREIRDPGDPPEMIQQHGTLLYHAFHFWRNGCPLVLVSVKAMRRAVSNESGRPTDLTSSGCVYLQFPQHLVWVGPTEGEAPESLDGVFATWNGETLDTLAVAGVSQHRAGVVTLPVPSVSVVDLDEVAGQSMREDGGDFSSSIPGAEIDGLYGVESAGEVLKLVIRLLSVVPTAKDAGDAQVVAGPAPSTLAYKRLA